MIPDTAKLARYDDLADLVEEMHDENMAMRQALELALGALEDLIDYVDVAMTKPENTEDIAGLEAIEAIKEALAEPVFRESLPLYQQKGKENGIRQ